MKRADRKKNKAGKTAPNASENKPPVSGDKQRSTGPIRERRVFSGSQVRAMMADEKPTGASGYAAVFNEVIDFGWFREKIAPGAFTRALSENQDVRALENHDSNRLIGRTKAGTLKLSQDDKGLKFDCEFPDTQIARDLLENLSVGNIDQCSFGFMVTKQTWQMEKNADGDMDELRIIEDVDLFDVSIVTYPAYEGTSAAARSALKGAPDEVRARILKRNDDCECECPECVAGDCDDCSDTDCDDENCRCMDRSRSRRDKPKTKRVDGEDLGADAFLIVGDANDTSTWKLPVKFSTDAKTKSHLQNALARFNQLDGVSEEDKKAAWTKLVKLCKDHGIEVSDEESKSHGNFKRRDFDYDGDGDNDQPLVDALHNATADASDFATVAAAALSEVGNADKKDGPPALAKCLAEAKELQGLLTELVKEIESEQSEDNEDDTERMKMRLRVAQSF